MAGGMIWTVGGAVALGVLVGGAWMAGRPVRGWLGWAAALHGALGAAGLALVVAALGPGALAAWMLAAALAGGALVAAAHWRGRPAPTLAVLLHASFGLGGALLLLGALR
jgi:hypothetical protein